MRFFVYTIFYNTGMTIVRIARIFDFKYEFRYTSALIIYCNYYAIYRIVYIK